MPPRLILAIFTAFVVGGCRFASPSENAAGDSSIAVDTLFTVGLPDPIDRDDALLIYPGPAVVDSEGNLFVADKAELIIKVYDPSGKFLTGLGSRGEGPGEFRAFSAIQITPGDEIVVFDALNSRVSLFRLVDGYIGGIEMGYRLPISLAWADGDVLQARYDDSENMDQPHILSAQSLEGDPLLVFRSDWTRVLSAGDLFDGGDQIARLLWRNFPSALTAYQGGVLVTPVLFEGNHYVLRRENGLWKRAGELIAPVSTPAVSAARGPADAPADVVASLPGRLKLRAQVHNQSRGVHIGPDGTLYHLLELEEDGMVVLCLQVHNPDGSYRGKRTLLTKPLDEFGGGYIYAELYGRDGSDLAYIAELQPVPLLHRVRLHVD